jgi:hypothetical protein
MVRARAGWLAMLLMASTAACAGPNLWTDGTSVSTGTTSRGRLRHPAKLPLKGPGFVVPPRWEERGFQYGVDELVAAVQRAARRSAAGPSAACSASPTSGPSAAASRPGTAATSRAATSTSTSTAST